MPNKSIVFPIIALLLISAQSTKAKAQTERHPAMEAVSDITSAADLLNKSSYFLNKASTSLQTGDQLMACMQANMALFLAGKAAEKTPPSRQIYVYERITEINSALPLICNAN